MKSGALLVHCPGLGVDGGRVAGVFRAFMCLFVCFPRHVSKTDAARITKLGTETFHHDFWKPIYFGVKAKGQGHEAHKHCRRGSYALVSAGFLLSFAVVIGSVQRRV